QEEPDILNFMDTDYFRNFLTGGEATEETVALIKSELRDIADNMLYLEAKRTELLETLKTNHEVKNKNKR
ncbi:MAG TPA: hypothetical protein VJK72_06100, partial [Candidatus Nanoarchaeia archaeon]|nr:hypothetical protein [Candidatus Nanoarchaeia archaeon]